MQIRIKGLIPKKMAGGAVAFYWQPNTPERKAGWTALPLGSDLQRAIKLAEERNDEIRAWRDGGGKPRAVKRFVAPRTFGHVIATYRTEHLAKQAASTRRTAATPLARLEKWAGDKPLAFITRARVRALRDAMMAEGTEGYLGHHAAFAVLSMGRQVMAYAADTLDLLPASDNPFLRFGLGKPAPRNLFWEHRHVEPMLTAATACQMPSIGLALEIGLYIGQREGDILKLPLSAWREIPRSKFRMTPGLYDALTNHDGPHAGKVMGIYVEQGKTKRWVGIPIEGDMRRRIERAIAHARAIGSTTILNCERTGLPWGQDEFIHKFGEVRAKAAETCTSDGDSALGEEIAARWFGDTRRSCVVTLGELGLDDAAISGVTGHSLATIKSILEVYMPRTEAMAGRAIAARITSLADAHKDKEARENMG